MRSNNKTIALVALLAISVGVLGLVQDAEATCWWGCSPGEHGDTKQMHYKIGYQHLCPNGGNCVTMSDHWQPISEGDSDTIGIYTTQDHDWIRPIIQAKTMDASVHASWYEHAIAIDDDNQYITGSSDTFSKRYYYNIPQAETTFERSSSDAPSGSLVTVLITVSQIS